MLPTDLQLLVWFKAVRPVSKLSLSTFVHVCTFIVVHAMPRLRGLRMCDMCAMYTTQLAAERHAWLCTENVCFFMSVFPRRLQSQEINPVKEQEKISVYCLYFQLRSRQLLKCNVCGGQYHRQCVNLFVVKIARRKNSVLHVDANLLSLINLISFFAHLLILS